MNKPTLEDIVSIFTHLFSLQIFQGRFNTELKALLVLLGDFPL